MSFLANYGLFFAKVFTLVICVLALIGGIVGITNRAKDKSKLKIKRLNEFYDELRLTMQQRMFSESQLKASIKQLKKDKQRKQKGVTIDKKRIFVLSFEGDIRASAVHGLRNTVTAVLTVAKPTDEVVVCLESSGGMVHAYGLAASQLERIKQKGIAVTVIIDKVAASGGYLMASVADKILAAPFAIIGSIGVVAQLPNFHRLLKKNHIDFEQMTAGEFKRTLTVFGENTEKAKQKFQEELDSIHDIFKQFIARNRPILDLAKVATGEHWLATQAIELNLIDGMATSDDYLLNVAEQAEVFKVSFEEKKNLRTRLLGSVESLMKNFSL